MKRANPTDNPLYHPIRTFRGERGRRSRRRGGRRGRGRRTRRDARDLGAEILLIFPATKSKTDNRALERRPVPEKVESPDLVSRRYAAWLGKEAPLVMPVGLQAVKLLRLDHDRDPDFTLVDRVPAPMARRTA